MDAYQALRDEVNRRVDNTQVLDRIVQELVLVERRRLNSILGRGLEPEYDSVYANKMKAYIHAKLYAHRQRRDNDSWMLHRSYEYSRCAEADDAARRARIEAMKELDAY